MGDRSYCFRGRRDPVDVHDGYRRSGQAAGPRPVSLSTGQVGQFTRRRQKWLARSPLVGLSLVALIAVEVALMTWLASGGSVPESHGNRYMGGPDFFVHPQLVAAGMAIAATVAGLAHWLRQQRRSQPGFVGPLEGGSHPRCDPRRVGSSCS